MMMDANQERMLAELHAAVVGTTREPGLREKVDRLDERVRNIEAIRAGISRGFWERMGTAAVAAASGWFAAHFGGTRP
jgi:hypothetical protein